GTVTLTDLGNTVRFDVVNQAGAGSKLDSLFFNFAKGTFNPNQLEFSNISAAVGTFNTQLAMTQDSTEAGLKPDGDGFFDGKIEYTTGNFLANGQTLSFELGLAGQDLDPSNFNFLSIPGPGAGNPGPFTLASHIQAIPPGNT